MKQTEHSNLAVPLWIIIACIGFVIIYIGKNILSLLFLTWILLILFSGIYRFFYKYTKINIVSLLITWGIFVLFFLSIAWIVSIEMEAFSEDIWKIQTWFGQLLENLPPFLWSVENLKFEQIFDKIEFSQVWKTIFGIISWFFGWLFTVWILLIFIASEKKLFVKKLQKVLGLSSRKKLRTIYKEIYEDLNVFILSKFSIALFNAFMSYIVMSLFGLEYALLFALFVFFLDFIPAVWWVIAIWLPFLYSFVQFDATGMSFLLAICMLVPQMISGNFLEPRIMWDRLNISSTVIILSLIFWSSMWWGIWAFLAVPIMAVANIVLWKFKYTEAIAIMLSKNWKL